MILVAILVPCKNQRKHENLTNSATRRIRNVEQVYQNRDR